MSSNLCNRQFDRAGRRSAFTLVELAIVLVILGLLVGGVMSGQSLIKAAELRAVTTELQEYKTAVYAFNDAYMALPGDITNATAFFPAAVNDGNGNGIVGTNVDVAESFLFWQHLALAGLVAGEYTGVAGSGAAAHHIAGENAPASKFGQGFWSVTNWNTCGGTRYCVEYGNSFQIGGPRAANATQPTSGNLFTPEEAWNIDTKIDDGMPGQGSAILVNHQGCSESANQNDLDADYSLAVEDADCAMMFRQAF